MFLNILDFILIPIQAALWRIGGAGKEEIKFARSWYRDTIIPVLNFLYYFWTANFIIGILTGMATLSIRMGYGAYDPEHDTKPSWLAKLTKDREGWKIRGLYGAITAFSIGLFPTIWATFFLYGIVLPEIIIKFICYILIVTIIEIYLSAGRFKGNVWVVETVTGASRALVFLICR